LVSIKTQNAKDFPQACEQSHECWSSHFIYMS